ncbi:uncharacterized protein F5Z01DRAFT_661002 [Emericellopsis atlantica]|uniref:Uncharacterized protein n=1 Tax=Emericellopsis atlantica TaxID=2614577 RepID=A0A9P7ZI86_9HYPO|nr:uncharacterized protein F5Z01DRAFT_661002 [Emericellopsis atlantica]KAG9252167.1 hypothetical protein F5Z01DRAFT_661002 [Emericellopsis atlantica]
MGDKVLHRHRIHYIIVCFAKRWERNPTVQEADLAELVYDVYTADMLLRSDTIHAPLVLPSDNPVDPNVTLLKELTVMHTNFLRVARVLQTEYICLAIKHQNVFGDSQSGGDHMLATMSANTGEALQDELTKAAQCFEVEAARGLCVSISEAQFMASMLGDYIKSIIGNESSQSHAQDGMDIDEPSGTASVAGTQHDEPSSEWEGFGESSSEWEGLD